MQAAEITNPYQLIYQDNLKWAAEWLRRGAPPKTRSIECLLNRNGIHPTVLMELGCGTGAVIEGCREKALARRYLAVDCSQEAIRYLRGRTRDVATMVADIGSADFQVREDIDVVVLSHVVEHIENPQALLRSLANRVRFRYAIIEVPLENLPLLRLKSTLWGRNQSAGHVSFFREEEFERLIHSSGLRILDRHRYVPVFDLETIRLVCRKDGSGRSRQLLRFASQHYLPRYMAPLWSRFYYAHLAVLCERDRENAR